MPEKPSISIDFTAEQIRMLNERSLADMFYNQHLSKKEIAEKIGIKVGVIYNRLKLFGIK